MRSESGIQSKKVRVFCKNEIFKLILAPACDHRGLQVGSTTPHSINKTNISCTRHKPQLVRCYFSQLLRIHHRKHQTHTKIHPKNNSIRGTLRKKAKHISNITTKPLQHNLTYKNQTKKHTNNRGIVEEERRLRGWTGYPLQRGHRRSRE